MLIEIEHNAFFIQYNTICQFNYVSIVYYLILDKLYILINGHFLLYKFLKAANSRLEEYPFTTSMSIYLNSVFTNN